MAAAIVPLVAAAIPEFLDVVSFIASLIHPKVKEVSGTATAGTGPVAFADVFAFAMGELAKAHAAGTIQTIPDDGTVKLILQAVYTSRKLSGDLASVPASTTPISSADANFVLKPGTSVTIRAA